MTSTGLRFTLHSDRRDGPLAVVPSAVLLPEVVWWWRSTQIGRRAVVEVTRAVTIRARRLADTARMSLHDI